MKKRIDILLHEKGFAKSREKAKAIIISGNVIVNNQYIKNPSEVFEDNCNIILKADNCPFVSRGALKLKKAIEVFNINIKNKICADIGASTGGFTDLMLHFGADKIYAIDVGYGQLDWKLRNNPKIINMERTNARYLNALNQRVEFLCADVSFISLKHIFPAMRRISIEKPEIVTLIKPQFEAGKDKIGKKGVIKDKNIHIDVIKNVAAYALESNFAIKDITFSPIKGPNGNIEFLAYLVNSSTRLIDIEKISNIVENAHLSFA